MRDRVASSGTAVTDVARREIPHAIGDGAGVRLELTGEAVPRMRRSGAPGFLDGSERLSFPALHCEPGRSPMAESVYRVTEVIGVSSESWEAAARAAVETAGRTVRDLRVAEVVRQDVTIGDGGVVNFRIRLAISFKYDSGE
jgi:flavin-binding protein dodecin